MIDSHCHIAGEEFAGDLPAVIDRARAAGLSSALVILAADSDEEIAQWSRVHELWPDTRAAVGVHPHHAHLFAADPRRRRAAGGAPARQPAGGAGRRRDRPGLSLRLLAARGAAGGVPGAAARWPGSATCPSSSTRARPKTTRCESSASPGASIPQGCFTASPGDTAAATRALATGFYLSIPGIVIVSEGRGAAGGAWPPCRSTGCWSRPTARTWRRCRIAESGTSRPTWRGWWMWWPKPAGCQRQRSGRPFRRTSTRLFRP